MKFANKIKVQVKNSIIVKNAKRRRVKCNGCYFCWHFIHRCFFLLFLPVVLLSVFSALNFASNAPMNRDAFVFFSFRTQPMESTHNAIENADNKRNL